MGREEPAASHFVDQSPQAWGRRMVTGPAPVIALVGWTTTCGPGSGPPRGLGDHPGDLA